MSKLTTPWPALLTLLAGHRVSGHGAWWGGSVQQVQEKTQGKSVAC